MKILKQLTLGDVWNASNFVVTQTDPFIIVKYQNSSGKVLSKNILPFLEFQYFEEISVGIYLFKYEGGWGIWDSLSRQILYGTPEKPLSIGKIALYNLKEKLYINFFEETDSRKVPNLKKTIELELKNENQFILSENSGLILFITRDDLEKFNFSEKDLVKIKGFEKFKKFKGLYLIHKIEGLLVLVSECVGRIVQIKNYSLTESSGFFLELKKDAVKEVYFFGLSGKLIELADFDLDTICEIPNTTLVSSNLGVFDVKKGEFVLKDTNVAPMVGSIFYKKENSLSLVTNWPKYDRYALSGRSFRPIIVPPHLFVKKVLGESLSDDGRVYCAEKILYLPNRISLRYSRDTLTKDLEEGEMKKSEIEEFFPQWRAPKIWELGDFLICDTAHAEVKLILEYENKKFKFLQKIEKSILDMQPVLNFVLFIIRRSNKIVAELYDNKKRPKNSNNYFPYRKMSEICLSPWVEGITEVKIINFSIKNAVVMCHLPNNELKFFVIGGFTGFAKKETLRFSKACFGLDLLPKNFIDNFAPAGDLDFKGLRKSLKELYSEAKTDQTVTKEIITLEKYMELILIELEQVSSLSYFVFWRTKLNGILEEYKAEIKALDKEDFAKAVQKEIKYEIKYEGIKMFGTDKEKEDENEVRQLKADNCFAPGCELTKLCNRKI